MQAEIRQVKLLNPDGKANSTKFMLGATGSGKTNLIANELLDSPRWILFDTKNDFATADSFFGGEVTRCGSVAELATAMNDDKRKIIFELYKHVAEMDDLFDETIMFIWDFQLANKDSGLPEVDIAVDELNRFVESKKSICPGMIEIVQRGRDLGVKKIFGAQWFNTIPPYIRDSFSEMWIFNHTDKNGLATLENFGFASDEVKNLPRYVALHRDANGIKKITLAA